MAKTFNLHFGIQIDGNDYTEVLTKMCNMRQDILNNVNNEAILRFLLMLTWMKKIFPQW